MKSLLPAFVLAVVVTAILSCNGQSSSTVNSPTQSANTPQNIVGGGCDGCELMYVGMPAPEQMAAADTSAGWQESGQQLLVQGKVLQLDGKTPAPGIIIYYWQTDNEGYYSPAPGQNDQEKRHGHIRGWIKTDDQGRYALYTIRPAPYPNRSIPAHIHLSIKEPNIKDEYYVDELVFDDDPLLTAKERTKLEKRGGSGIMTIRKNGRLQVAEHDIILGLNIPNYPT